MSPASAHLWRCHDVKEAFLCCFQSYCYLHEAVFLNDFIAKTLEHEVTDSSLYLHTLTSSFTCMKVSEKKKRNATLPWIVKAAAYHIKNLDFLCWCWSWKNMQNVSVQLAGKLINGLPSKWSTGESMACGQASRHSAVITFARLCTYTASDRSSTPCLALYSP